MSEVEQLVRRAYGTEPKYTELKAGLPEDYSEIKTLRDLLEISYKIVEVKEQLRKNLIRLLKSGSPRYPHIIGYDDDVVPALDRAILSGHDVFLIGQIGQAKTKIIETIASTLLSPMPVIEGSITNDCPMDLPADELIMLLEGQEVVKSDPRFYLSPESSQKILDNKLDTKISWVDGRHRFKYVLATPDISVKDLVGYIDAIKVAKKGVEMYKIDSYSPGQLMQAKHGIFCIDELPVLDPRKQVALLSVLQEGRYTTGAYPVVFEPRIAFFATANPIDYTHSGKIIEPLYDRLKSHIHTHYPKNIEDEMCIVIQEAKLPNCYVPIFVLKTLVRLVHNARSNSEINQAKGVSVRLGIHGLELLVGESERMRAIPYNAVPVPRHSDMYCLSQIAKFELSEIDDTIENRHKLFYNLLEDSIKQTCLEYIQQIPQQTLDVIKQEFADKSFRASQKMVWEDGPISYIQQLKDFPNLDALINQMLNNVAKDFADFEQKLNKLGIKSQNLQPNKELEGDLKAALLEVALDGLCYVTPKILDKKDASYVSA